MDEIDWIKNIKKFLNTIIISFIIISVVVLVITLIRNTINDEWKYISTDLLVVFIIGVPIPVLLTLCYIIMYLSAKVINSGRKVINYDKNYIREIPKSCSPAVASLVYDLKIDVYKDYTATILYLCTKKYIDMIKYDDSYKIILGRQTDYSKLGKCEKYVLNTIIDKSKFDENQFKQEIINEAQEKLLITDQMHSKKIKWTFIVIICFILCAICYKVNIYLFVIYLSIVPISIGTYHAIQSEYAKNTEYIRTKKGKEIAMILEGLKNYIKEYTLIKDKEIDYIQILEDYIPYAISLDEADTIEEFIKYNEEYRNLIYNRKIDKS